MKISFIAKNDFANVLTEYAYCLNKHSEDIEAKSICLHKHAFNYSNQHDYNLWDCTYDQRLEAQKFIFESDIIIFGEEQKGDYIILNQIKQILGIDLLNSNKKLGNNLGWAYNNFMKHKHGVFNTLLNYYNLN